ncbi:MAG: ABC transporter substrate-binding protein [Planctomycetaceae bacterium]|nr:ABC transporter substrate-binding protein [Planctomycetaceae bacterium]
MKILFGPYMLPAILVLTVLSGCGNVEPPSSRTNEETKNASTGFPITLTDALGRDVTFDAPPQRIISVAPKNTELIYFLGFDDRLVGVTTFCNYPPAAAKLDKIGGLTAQTINQELIVALNPDLILCSDRMHEPLIPQWEALGLKAFVLGAESLDAMYEEMQLLGRMMDDTEAADELIDSLSERVETIETGIAKIPADERPKLFYQVWDDPLMGAGPNSFIGQMMELTGGENILSDVKEPYPYVAHEIVVERNPDVIFAPTTHSQEVNPEEIARQPAWKGINAAKNKRIYLLDGDEVSRRGPRMIDALETMVALLYPERFGHYLDEGEGEPE